MYNVRLTSFMLNSEWVSDRANQLHHLILVQVLLERYFNNKVVWRWCGAALVYGIACLLISLSPWASLIYNSQTGLYEFDPVKRLTAQPGNEEFPVSNFGNI